ncbi:hypothetical protein [Pseudodesulfovibrio sp.]|uniref:glycosyltransferase n=1 Tax=Pseudodesulfovibrio sp. TaxID=2035812 RepID=UPI0026208075|nr:hypothetical protein [Pseudodesulfovibrio sp.]MDD3312391.1 hypothetical protein [Pseudodesulfovibrio sp.]
MCESAGRPEEERPRILFHVPFKLGYAISGGGIRPGKLIRAFEGLGYAVDVISGPLAQRRQAIGRAVARLEGGGTYAFCYAESSVLPTLLTEKGNKPFYPFSDFDLFALLRRRSVPVGLFYRDIFWKYPYHRQRFGPFERWRRQFFHHLDFWYYRRVLDVLFVPDLAMTGLLPRALAAKAVACPPGHDVGPLAPRRVPASAADLSLIYVGGVVPPVWDITPVLRLAERMPVTICCREQEWGEWGPRYGGLPPDATVRHLSGDQLLDAYAGHALAAILRNPHPYHDHQVPLKLFEAVGHGIPLLAGAGTRVGDYVREQGIGWAVRPDLADLDADAVVREYPAVLARLAAIRDEHTWERRARHIADTLQRAGRP